MHHKSQCFDHFGVLMTNKESLFAGLHILMRAILVAQRTPAAGFADTGIEKAAAKSASAAKNKISVNQRNPRLMNYLCAYKAPCKALYICRETFTDVMSALQIKLFMQNKPNFRKSQMNVNKVLTKDYEKRTLGERGKNEPKTNPIKANQSQFAGCSNERIIRPIF